MKLLLLFFCVLFAFCHDSHEKIPPCEEREEYNKNINDPTRSIPLCPEKRHEKGTRPSPAEPFYNPKYEIFVINDPATTDVWGALKDGHKILEGIAIINNFDGSGDVKLDFVLGCLEIDLKGHNEINFMMDTLFEKDLFNTFECTNKIRNSGADEVCLEKQQMMFLEKNGFEIGAKIKECDAWYTYKMAAGTLRHDMYIVDEILTESDLEDLKMIRRVEGRIVCSNSILENFKFLENIVYIAASKFDAKKRRPTIDFEGCTVLNQTAFLPNLVALISPHGKVKSKEVYNPLVSIRNNYFSLDDETIKRLKTAVKNFDPKNKEEIVIENNYNISRQVVQEGVRNELHLVYFFIPMVLAVVLLVFECFLKDTATFYLNDPVYIREFLGFSYLKALKIEGYDPMKQAVAPAQDVINSIVDRRNKRLAEEAKKLQEETKGSGEKAKETEKKGSKEGAKPEGPKPDGAKPDGAKPHGDQKEENPKGN